MTEKQKRVQALFSVVAEKNELTYIRGNIYEDPRGELYYLDLLGFHRQVVFSNHELRKKEDSLDALIKKYSDLIEKNSEDGLKKRLEAQSTLLENRRKKFLKILKAVKTPDREKLRLIGAYLNNTEIEDKSIK